MAITCGPGLMPSPDGTICIIDPDYVDPNAPDDTGDRGTDSRREGPGTTGRLAPGGRLTEFPDEQPGGRTGEEGETPKEFDACGVGFSRNASGVCVPDAEGADSELIDPRSKTGLNVPGNWLRHLRGLMLGGISGNIFGGDKPSTNIRTIRSSLQRRTIRADERRRRG